MSTETRAEDMTVLGGFDRILGEDSPWVIGGFQLPDGSRWDYREPGAIVVVRNGRLRVSVPVLTRRNDRVQVLDNAKHMYFSRERVATAGDGPTSFEVTIAATGIGTTPNDLYDGFVSLNLLDFQTGTAIDFFVSNDTIATVYARLPFPGVPEPSTGATRYYCIFKEIAGLTSPGQAHDYRIVYDRTANEFRWSVDGVEVDRHADVPDTIDGFTVALGLMTEKDLGPQGSTSLHGQGLIGEWSAVRVRRGA